MRTALVALLFVAFAGCKSRAPAASVVPRDDTARVASEARRLALAATFQTRIVPSPLPDANVPPSGEKATERTAAVWPRSVPRPLPVAVSQSLM